eukprot:scaffold80_cov325-Pavlova_lutheri.AAC.33
MSTARDEDGANAAVEKAPPPLFAPFRALGVIFGGVRQAWSVRRQGDATYVTVGTGESNAWQVYDCAKLKLVMVGPMLEDPPNCIASAKRDVTATASGREIAVCVRAHRAGTWRKHRGSVIQMLPLGNHILSLGEDNLICLWSIEEMDSNEPAAVLEMEPDCQPTCMVHPETYLNKILVADRSGRMQLWNIVSKKCIYEFQGWDCPISCLASAPAVDVVAVGLADGRVILHNLRFDETITTFHDTTGVKGGPVQAISFRTGVGIPLMASGGALGVITVWDLEKKTLHTVMKDAHEGGVSQLHFFVGEPVLMSAGVDNSIKQWIFDNMDGSARLLRYRSGHSAPPGLVRYYADDRQIISAGNDKAVRVFSTIQDQQSKELSQGHVESRAKKFQVKEEELKLGRVVGMASSQIREKDWCNLITCHEGDRAAYLWSLKDSALGQHKLIPPGKLDDQTPITCVGLSVCGNFGIVGTSAGKVERFNVQSGLHRGSYKRIDKSKQHPSRKRKGIWSAVSAPDRYATRSAHEDKVTGVFSDARNKTLVSCSADGYLRFWDFRTRRLTGEIRGGFELVKMAPYQSGSLVAVANSEFVVSVFDIVAKRLVRRFAGHSAHITDLCFSNDGHWILSSSLDGTVRCWDVMHSKVLQVMELGGTVSSLSLSPSLDMLATSILGRRGIYLWANRLYYTKEGSIPPSELPVDVSLPANVVEIEDELGIPTSGINGSDVDEAKEEEKDASIAHAEDLKAMLETAPRPITPGMATLSLIPRSHWRTLVHLEEIKERNKPLQPPKKPEAAPFFLPTAQEETFGKDVKFDSATLNQVADNQTASRVQRRGNADIFAETELVRLVQAGADGGDFASAASYLRGMPPNLLEAEVRSLILNEPGQIEPHERQVLASVLDFAQAELSEGRNFELIQGFLGLFLRIQADVLSVDPELKARSLRVSSQVSRRWKHLDYLFQETNCMLNLFTNMQ